MHDIIAEVAGAFFSPDDFERVEIIGRGSEGTVYKAKWKGSEDSTSTIPLEFQEELAIKISTVIMRRGSRVVLTFFREVFNQVYSAHPAVLPLLGWGIKMVNENRLELAIVMKKMKCALSSMRYYCCYDGKFSKKIELTPTNRSIIAYGIARGMAHLHSLGVFHRDLKCENVMLDDRNYPYIADLGMSKITTEASEQSVLTGTVSNWSPELFRLRQKNERRHICYSFPADVYAFATIAYDLWTQKNFFKEAEEESQYHVTNYILTGKRPLIENATTIQEELLKRMWAQNEDDRPTFGEIAELLEKEDYWVVGTDAAEFRAYVSMINQAELHKTPLIGNSRWLDGIDDSEDSLFRSIDEAASEEDAIAKYVRSLCSVCGKYWPVQSAALATISKNIHIQYADLLVRTFKSGSAIERAMYHESRGDLSTAMKCYEEAALTGDITATAKLGAINLAQGHKKEGLRLLKIAARAKDVRAVYTLIEYYSNKKMSAKAQEWLSFAEKEELTDVVDEVKYRS